MPTIHVLNQITDQQARPVFAGMFGQMDGQGKFKFDASLKTLHLVRIAQHQIDNGESALMSAPLALHPVEISDRAQNCFKATMLALLGQRWDKHYATSIAMLSGTTREMYVGERAIVAETVIESLDALGYKPEDFEQTIVDFDVLNAQPRLEMTDDGYDSNEDDSGTYKVTASADKAISHIQAESLMVIQRADLDQVLAPDRVASIDCMDSTNFVSGGVTAGVSMMRSDDAEIRREVSAAMLTLPVELREILQVIAHSGFHDNIQQSVNPLHEAPPRQMPETQQVVLLAPAVLAQTQVSSQGVDEIDSVANAFLRDAVYPSNTDNGDEEDGYDVPRMT